MTNLIKKKFPIQLLLIHILITIYNIQFTITIYNIQLLFTYPCRKLISNTFVSHVHVNYKVRIIERKYYLFAGGQMEQRNAYGSELFDKKVLLFSRPIPRIPIIPPYFQSEKQNRHGEAICRDDTMPYRICGAAKYKKDRSLGAVHKTFSYHLQKAFRCLYQFPRREVF